MIKQLKFVSVPTSDQDRPLAFWTEKVGFRVATDQPMGPARRWIELSIGSFFNGSFGCDDVDHTWRQMTTKGVEFDGPPEKQPWGTFAKFKDPDGNTFVLSSR
jgi:catechol 2,3-dioxygenase-like lactoylglutathione lyase family enzyme